MILQDKVALVTGGTSGIGRATALAYPYGEASYAQRSVGAASRREGKLNEVIAYPAFVTLQEGNL
jgi:NAD(P)-dependent dehydrogenase (short-subunit alcohol dehydrogenase family)